MSKILDSHIDRLRTALLRRHTAASIARWITENTFHDSVNYSYKDHEYQEAILSDVAREVVVRKCSQVGISEASARMALALVAVLNPYTVAYTLPTANFAGVFAKTRIDPIIDGSKALTELVHRTNNNNEVKQFGDSFLFLRGAASSNSPISIPVDHLIHDELDFSDLTVLGQYVSRLTHSKWKRKTKISTPTLKGYGIDKEFTNSRRHFLHAKCSHCGHWFLPSYYDHVRIPKWTGDLRGFEKRDLGKSRWQEATLRCPKCDMVPDLSPAYREWVLENPDDDKFVASGYQVSPFDAPKIIVPSYLVEASVSYDRRQDFDNFNLGLPADDKEATLSKEDFKDRFIMQMPGSGRVNVMGIDVGNLYHATIWSVDGYGRAIVIHREVIPMGRIRVRYHELRRQYRVVCSVMDSAPHAETVMALQEQDENLYAAVYCKKKTLLTYEVKERDESESEGKSFVRQVDVNRNRAFDAYMEFIRSDNMLIVRQNEELDELFMIHHFDMKRTKVFSSESGEPEYIWQKTDGNDHFHHSGLYAMIASRIKGLGRSEVALPLFNMFKARVAKEVPKQKVRQLPLGMVRAQRIY